jgi:hypothetical protein
MTKNKAFKLCEAQEILHEMHFGARVQRNGRGRGWKYLMWTDLKGNNYHQPFSPQTTWEEIIEFAKTQVPVWDKALLFAKGDIIELDWGYKTRIQALVLGVPGDGGIHGYSYELQSPGFKNKSGIYWLNNYDLKFHKNAVKISRSEVSPP